MKRFLKYSVALAGLTFALFPLVRGFGGLQGLRFSLQDFLLGTALLVLAYSLLPLIWLSVGRSFSLNMSLREAVSSWYVSSVGRYVPGKVWQFVGRASMLDHPTSKVISAMFYEHLVLMTGASLVSLVHGRLLHLKVFITFILLLSLLTWKRLVLLLGRLFPSATHYPSAWGGVVLSVVLAVLYWTLAGFSAYLVAGSVGWKGGWREITFVFSFSFVTSYLLPITPAGLGIREGIISVLLGYDVQSSAFSLLSRLSTVVADLITFAVGVGLGFHRK